MAIDRQKIVRQIDDIESEVFTLYHRLARLRLDLQREWRVFPSGEPWTQQKQDEADHR